MSAEAASSAGDETSGVMAFARPLLNQGAQRRGSGVDVEGEDVRDAGGTQARRNVGAGFTEADESDGGLGHRKDSPGDDVDGLPTIAPPGQEG